MKPRNDEKDARDSQRNKDDAENERKSPENDPAIERGERIATGKSIARGGKANGFVPGAAPDQK